MNWHPQCPAVEDQPPCRLGFFGMKVQRWSRRDARLGSVVTEAAGLDGGPIWEENESKIISYDVSRDNLSGGTKGTFTCP